MSSPVDTNTAAMNKTRVDELIIEMISPKIKEIEQKFSQGQGLTQEDINTLLLKSQFNHINHLDGKLDAVTASVVALEGKFSGLKTDLEGKFTGLEGKFNVLKTDLEGKFNLLDNRVMTSLETLGEQIKANAAQIEAKIAHVDVKLAQIEVKIERAVNSTMRWSIGLIALIVTALKLADQFL